MEGFKILIGREHIDPKLPMSADPSLARVMGQMNLCTCFAGVIDGKNVASILLNEQNVSGGICDITNIAVAEDYVDTDVKDELMLYVMDYARTKGFHYLEIGIGNSHVNTHRELQKMGYRVVGVIPDYYQSDSRTLAVEHGIVNRDMIRYRVDFNDGWATWTKEVKQKFEQ